MATKKDASGRARSRYDKPRRAHKRPPQTVEDCPDLERFERTSDKVAAAPRKAVATQATARVAADDPLSTHRVEYLASIFTRAQLARWIGVSPSQTSRWASGAERPGPAAAPALIDLEHVYSRARLVWGEEAARIWLESANAFLSGARPLDVLLTDGPARVLEALDAEMWGGAA